jgi:hypothetical protein
MPSSTPVNRRALLTLLGGSIAAPLAAGASHEAKLHLARYT